MILEQKLPRETAREYALRMIRHNITMLELEPGSKVSENELAGEMGISRTPVREALIELSKINIVEIFPQRGSYITLIDSRQVDEALFMRLTLEKAVMDLVCKQATSQQILELEQNVQLQKFYIDNNHSAKLMELDNEFHAKLFEIADKKRTYELIQSMMIFFDRVRRLHMKGDSNQFVVEDHEKIVQYIIEKDCGQGKKIMEQHLTRFKMNWEQMKKAHSGYFLEEDKL